MSIRPNTLAPSKGAKKGSKRLGRGNGSQKGTMSGRGGKGQKARSGGKRGRRKLGFKKALQQAPKLRGFKSIEKKARTITLRQLVKAFSAGDVVTPWTLEQKGLVTAPKNGVKIVSTGDIAIALTVRDCHVSKTAAEAIEKAGGSIAF
jgi:large subunit ribosomal protein L15